MVMLTAAAMEEAALNVTVIVRVNVLTPGLFRCVLLFSFSASHLFFFFPLLPCVSAADEA